MKIQLMEYNADGHLTVSVIEVPLDSLDRLLEMLRANNLSQLQEIHLLHLSDPNSDETEFAGAVRRATGKPVYVAKK